MQAGTQEPKLVVQLAGQQAAASAGAGAWLQLSPDTMHQYRLCSQQTMLVGLCHPPEAAAGAALTSPSGRARTPSYSASSSSSMSSPGLGITPSTFAPSAVALQPDQVQLVDLWLRAGLLQQQQAGQDQQQEPQQQQQQQQHLPGRFLLPVCLWPCAKLARGVALISSSVWSGLVQPEQGAFLALYSMAPAAAAAVAPAKQLSVHLCTDPQQQNLLTPQHIQLVAGHTPGAAAAAAAGGPASPAGFTTPTRKPPSTPGGKTANSSSSKKAKSGSKGSKQQQQQEAKQGVSSSGGLNPVAQWQLQLLQDGLDWSKPRQRQLMQQLVHKQLLGCAFLSGNVTYIPVLGAKVLCLLQPAGNTLDEQQQQQQQQQTLAGVQPPLPIQQPPLQVTSSTQLQLLAPNEQQPGLPTLQAVLGLQSATAVEGPGNAAAAAGGSSGLSASLQQRISAAREAAAAAVDGSAQEAAMEAAERAVRAGAAAVSGGGGYGRLGGIQQYSSALRELVLLPLQHPQLFARFKLRPPRGVLLHGPPGSGKTALARAAALESGAALLVVNGPDILTEYYGESEAGLSGIFAAAAALSPSIVFIDEVDAVAPSRDAAGHGGASSHTAAAAAAAGSAAGEAAARVLTQLLVLMDGLGSSGSSGSSGAAAGSSGSSGGVAAAAGSSGGGVAAATDARVVVIAATNRPAAVDPALRRPGRFEREIEVGVPDPAAREDILTVRLQRVKHSLTAEQVHQLAQHTQGFVGADLAALVNEAALAALRRHVTALQHHQQQPQHHQQRPQQQQQQQQQQQPQQQQQQQQAGQPQTGAGLCVCWQDFEAARLLVRPSALREVAVEVPQVSWDDVGGLGDVKQRLQEAVLWPQTHADALERLGATAPKGVLLFGPPGCSKTLLARAVAASSGLNFLSVKGGELYSSYVGESERAVAALFARARAAAPAVVFFDELDGLVSSRGDTGAGAGIGERVLAQLLTEMDGLQARLGVVVLAATNRPDKVDPALLRPGRFDRLLLVPPPDAAARQEIFRVHTHKTPLGGDVDLAVLAARTGGYTGADISAVCREAAMAALEQDLDAAAVCACHFDVALTRVQPSSPADSAMMAQYQQFQRHSQSGAQAAAWQPEGEVRFVV